MKLNKFSYIIFLLFIQLVFSQTSTNTVDVFKIHLFLNKSNVVRSDLKNEIVKNDSLFKVFCKETVLVLDTLKLDTDLYLPIDGQFSFYKLKEINYKNGKNWYLDIAWCDFSSYIIAINNYTGANFRLQGFENNDFFSFFILLKKTYRTSNFKKLRNSSFFKNYKVEGLDFKCIYKGLKSDILDKEKFPCLKTPSDTFSLHQFNNK